MYNVTLKKYYNSAQGTRYNLSVSKPQHRKTVYEVDNNVPTFGGEKVGRLVRPREKRDRCSVLRAIREIRNIGLSNDWDYFVTFTLDPAKFDRSNYPAAVKRMTRYFRYLRSECGYDIEYLLIPELHADKKNWHFHGLIKGIPDSLLTPHPLTWQREKGYKDFPDFSYRFGFVSLSPVTNTSAVVYYCLKYINKDIFAMRFNDGMRLYYVSRGVRRPEIVAQYNIDIHPGYIGNNLNSTDFGTGFLRECPPEVVKSVLEDLLFQDDFYNLNEV